VSETYFRTIKNVVPDFIVPIGNRSNGCGLLLVDLMWVTGSPALTPVNTSSERRNDSETRSGSVLG